MIADGPGRNWLEATICSHPAQVLGGRLTRSAGPLRGGIYQKRLAVNTVGYWREF